MTGNSCGFQPGIILELAKALSTSQKIIPSIRIKYEEILFWNISEENSLSIFFLQKLTRNNIIYLRQTDMTIRRTMVISLTTMLMIRILLLQ